MPRWPVALVLPLALAALAVGVPPDAQKDQPKKLEPSADAAATRAKVEGGLKAEVWAAEPLMANPVSFAFDEKGNCYVAETTRFDKGVPDTRGHMYWLDDDLACRTIADRVAMYKRTYPGQKPYAGFEGYSDQVRKVWDSTGAGKADKSTVFSGGYNRPEDGLGAGVLARKGGVYFANIPDLYKLTDADGDGVADKKESLATGFGLHVQFLGHDLHGLRMGPDGKLYFSIGDRGFNVTTREGKHLYNPDSGAVLRCDPDGRNMEIVHTGLRNPQELAFDDSGNLFTFDNNSDSGDRARWVQVVEGGDSGWRCGYQYGTLMHHAGVKEGNRGPWNAEKIWHVPDGADGPPAYVVPPLKHIGNGPSGITAYPGVGLSDRYKGHFFACDFTAGPGNSVIWSLALKPKGASFEVTDLHKFVQNMVPTDCEFGPDGAFYWSDWVGGWNPPGGGRIFRVADPTAMKNPAVGEAKSLLAEGFTKKSVDELAKLLEHPHRQVRQEAQFELAGRKPEEAVATFTKLAASSKNPVTRLHAVWGLGMIRPQNAVPVEATAKLATDESADVRAATANLLSSRSELAGWTQPGRPTFITTRDTLRHLTTDTHPRVQAAALIGYGKTTPDLTYYPGSETWEYMPMFESLKSNDHRDAYVRHAAVVGLSTRNTVGHVYTAWKQAGPKYDTTAVRLGIVLALRKLRDPKLAEFLADGDPKIAAEAARAIYDQQQTDPPLKPLGSRAPQAGIELALPALAALAVRTGLDEPVAYRTLAANYKLGTAEGASRVVAYAARSSEPDHLREFALKLLADWTKPARRDPITGLTQSLPARDAMIVTTAVRPVLPKLFAGSDLVRRAAVQLTSKLGIQDVGPIMAGLVGDSKQATAVRVEALYALEAVKAKELTASAKEVATSPEPKLRAAARTVLAKANPGTAGKDLAAIVADPSASPVEKQTALEALGGLKESREADTAIATQLDALAAGTLPAELQLDVREAALARTTAKNLTLHAPLKQKLNSVDNLVKLAAGKDPLATYRDALSGGDADRGRAVVLNNSAVYCQRCHRVDGQGGDVGPALNGVGGKHPRDYLLESVVNPNAKIADGYQSVILNTLDGKTVTGVLRAKDAKGYTVVTPDNKVVTVPKDDVEGEKPDKSAMPDDLHKKLTKRELRDVVEFLASLKDPVK